MPVTAVDTARTAATVYANALLAERTLLDLLPAPGHPDRSTVEATVAAAGRVARCAYDRYSRTVLAMLADGQELQACRIINDVHDRTRAARMPSHFAATEEPTR